jgi:hypothetical protein
MTHTGWNLCSKNPALKDVRRFAALWLLTLSLLASPTLARAADQPGRSFPSTSSTRRATDLEIETKARRALRNDAQLASLNLNVHVAGGTARLSGPVPSPQHKQRAIAIVERVEGVLRMTARDLYVSSTAEGPKRPSVLIEDDQPTQTRSASPLALSNGTAAPSPSNQQVTLLAPEPAPRPARVPEAARLTANPRPASPTISIPAALEQLRQRDRRFRQIRTQVQGATVYIYPSDAPGEDAMLFAQAIRRVPGVQNVLVAPGSR